MFRNPEGVVSAKGWFLPSFPEPAVALCPGRRKGSSDIFLPPSSLKAGAREWGATGKLSLSTLHGLQLGDPTKKKVTTSSHLWEALPGLNVVFSVFQWG